MATRRQGSDPSGARRVAVTGAASRIGQDLLGRLHAHPGCAHLLALDVEPDPPLPGVPYRALDLTRPTAAAELLEVLRAHRIDTLVHAAFLAAPTAQSAWAHELEAIGTLHVLDAAAAHPLEKLVVQGSTAVYGPHPRNPALLEESHALLGLKGSRYVRDRVEVERQVARFAREHPGTLCTSLRLGPVVGPRSHSWVARYLRLPTPFTWLGFDPMVQFLHERDAVDAFVLAVDRDLPGAWNVVPDGVLSLSAAIRLAGRVPLPLPSRVLKATLATLWSVQLGGLPASFADFLRYACVADGRRLREEAGFVPRYASAEAVSALRTPPAPSDLAGARA